MTPLNWLFLILAATLFGSSFVFTNIAVAEVPPTTLAAARVCVAVPVVLAFLFASGRRLPPLGRHWFPLIILGQLTAAIPYFAIAWGQSHNSSSLGGILFATIPIFTMLFAPVFVDEDRPTTGAAFGIAIAFVGVVLAIGPKSLTAIGTQSLGAAVTLAAAFSYAIGNIYARRQKGMDPVTMAAGQLVTAAVMLVPMALFVDGTMGSIPSMTAIISTIAVGVVSTAFPVLLMFMLVKKIGATRTSLLAFFIPVAAVLLGVSLLGESLNPLTLLGFAMIIGGAIWAAKMNKAPVSTAPQRSKA